MISDPLLQLGPRLREARLNAHLTVREAAERAGLHSHGTLVQYENGHVRPPLDRLAALASPRGPPGPGTEGGCPPRRSTGSPRWPGHTRYRLQAWWCLTRR